MEHLHEAPQWLYGEGLAENVLTNAEDQIADACDLDTDRLVERGDAARRIIALSEDAETEMVVMGSRGLSDFAGLVLGSVAHKVSHGARCPVVTVTPGDVV
jgi:nucleotide-binding universal stress UspA family protein